MPRSVSTDEATAPVLHLGTYDDLRSLSDLPPNETTVPQAMFQVRSWSDDVLHDVRVISTLLLNELMDLDADAFTDEPGAAELLGHLPEGPMAVPAA